MHYLYPLPAVTTVLAQSLVPLYLVSLLSASTIVADTGLTIDKGHSHSPIQFLNQPPLLDNDFSDHEAPGTYEPGFAGVDRSIIGRAPDDKNIILENNIPGRNEIDQDGDQLWTFPKTALTELQTPSYPSLPLESPNLFGLEHDLNGLWPNNSNSISKQTIYITLTTCVQPSSKDTQANRAPQPLEIYVSSSSSNTKPDNDHCDNKTTADGGYGSIILTNVTDDVSISVHAPKSDDFKDGYSYELTASVDAQYSTYFNYSRFSPDIKDTDFRSIIFASDNITSADPNSTIYETWMNLSVFDVYINQAEDHFFQSLQRSYCGLQNYARIKPNETSIIKIGGPPKQQFYVTGLNRSTTYSAVMVLKGNSTESGDVAVGRGGAVWDVANFTTKSDTNCRVIYNLSFCSDIAYAVPANPSNPQNPQDGDYNLSSLTSIYDGNAESLFGNFNKSLWQIPCNTTDTAKYSLARTCTDCSNDYKTWLCAVTIPRCHDFSSNLPFLLPRNINSSTFSNNNFVPNGTNGSLFSAYNKTTSYYGTWRKPVNANIEPRPFKEMLPCKDVCYRLVQSCPAKLQFACPLKGHGLYYSYGDFTKDNSREWTCNWPGGTLYNGAGIFNGAMWIVVISLAVTALA